jgi:hypothetical protein
MATMTDEQRQLMTQHAQMVGQPLAGMIWTVTPQTKLERLDAGIAYLERLLKDPATAGPPPSNPYPCCQFSGAL